MPYALPAATNSIYPDLGQVLSNAGFHAPQVGWTVIVFSVKYLTL